MRLIYFGMIRHECSIYKSFSAIRLVLLRHSITESGDGDYIADLFGLVEYDYHDSKTDNEDDWKCDSVLDHFVFCWKQIKH